MSIVPVIHGHVVFQAVPSLQKGYVSTHIITEWSRGTLAIQWRGVNGAACRSETRLRLEARAESRSLAARFFVTSERLPALFPAVVSSRSEGAA